MKKTFTLAIAFLTAAALAFCQAPIVKTTLSSNVAAGDTQVCVASATSITTPSLPTGTPGSILIVDKEALQVTAAGVSSTCFMVKRGVLGTAGRAHASGQKVWVTAVTSSSGDPSRPVSSSNLLGPGAMTGIYSPFSFYSTIGTLPIAATAKTYVAGTFYYGELLVHATTLITGVCIKNGATVGTDKLIYALFDHVGNGIANTALAGTTSAGATQFQCIDFTAPVVLFGPNTYFVGTQANGTTDNFGALAAGSVPSGYPTGSKTGTFGTIPVITVPSTFTADVGPQAFLY